MGMKRIVLQLSLIYAALRSRIVVTGAATSLSQIDWQAYERGDLGVYPQKRYYSNPAISAPLIHVTQSSEECDSSSYTFLSPRGHGIPGNKAFILDSRGELVWFHQELGAINEFRVQKYKGHEYLTYWVGDDDYHGHGHGYYKMLDQTYALAYTISALNGVDGDFHEFSITADNTALLTAYVKTPWDLSVIGRGDGFIWDCVFQEIDIETNTMLFEWRASQHFTFSDMAVNSWEEWVGSDEIPWDWFHINSVEKDSQGNYLVSARNANAIIYVDGQNGSVLWHLGGDHSSFAGDSEDRNAARFTNPQMARWADNYTAITLFDNAGLLLHDQVQRKSRGLKIRLDPSKQLATVVTELVHPDQVFAISGGSLQLLGNGNYFLSYGSASVYSEFEPSGAMTCNTHYSPIHTGKDADFRPGVVKSYRIYKQQWIGRPTSLPDAKFLGNTLHISWNGATEVCAWKLEGRGQSLRPSQTPWRSIGIFNIDNFETSIPVQGAYYASYKLTALDSDGYTIRTWEVHSGGYIREIIYESFANPSQIQTSPVVGILAILLCCGFLLVLNKSRGLYWTRFLTRRHSDLNGKCRVQETHQRLLSGWGSPFED